MPMLATTGPIFMSIAQFTWQSQGYHTHGPYVNCHRHFHIKSTAKMFLIPFFNLSRDCLYSASLTITQALCNLDRLATVAILNGTNTITGYSSTNLRKKKLFKNATICWKPSSTPGIVAEEASLESTRLICRLELKSDRLKNGNQSIPAR